MQPTFGEFLEACKTGDLETVKRALTVPNTELELISYGVIGLTEAAANGQLIVVNFLLENPEVVDRAAHILNSALYYAAQGGYLAVVDRLLEIPVVLAYATDGEDNVPDNDVCKVAACNGHLAVVERLLQIPAVKELFQSDNSVLKNIVGAGVNEISAGLDTVNYLLERGAGVIGDEPNELILLAIENENHDIAIRLLQEELIAKELKDDRSPIEENKDFFKEIEDRRFTRIVAAQCLYLNSVDQNAVSELPSNEHHGDAIHTRPIENQILTYLYHDVLCGKSACLERKKEDSFFKCPIISQFRDDAIGAKARAQAKLGTQATTSTSTNSSTEPSKKARHN